MPQKNPIPSTERVERRKSGTCTPTEIIYCNLSERNSNTGTGVDSGNQYRLHQKSKNLQILPFLFIISIFFHFHKAAVPRLAFKTDSPAINCLPA